MDETLTSTLKLLQNVFFIYSLIDRLAAIKRKGTWKESKPKKFKKGNTSIEKRITLHVYFFDTEKINQISAKSMKNYKNFVKWAEANVFKIESFVVHVQIIEETNIKMKWPLGYEYCPRCALYYIVNSKYCVYLHTNRCSYARQKNNLFKLLCGVRWKDLYISDVPDDVVSSSFTELIIFMFY